MDHYLPVFAILPILFAIAAAFKRSETVLWLAVVSVFGAIISFSVKEHWQLFTWIISANSIAAAMCASHYSRSRSPVALVVTILLAAGSAVNFGHLVYNTNTGTMSVTAGYATGLIGYAELIAVLLMKDCRGSLNGLVDDFRAGFVGFFHLVGNHWRH